MNAKKNSRTEHATRRKNYKDEKNVCIKKCIEETVYFLALCLRLRKGIDFITK